METDHPPTKEKEIKLNMVTLKCSDPTVRK